MHNKVDSHFRLRGKEDDSLGYFFWLNQPGDKSPNNKNQKVNVAGYFQPRIPNQNKKLLPAYSFRYYEVLNIGNSEYIIEGMKQAIKESGKIYPQGNFVALEAFSTLYWDAETRKTLEFLSLLPKDGSVVKQNSGSAVDSRYTLDAKNALLEILDKLNEVYKAVGYK